ncbi:hypothetical protein TNCV_4524821 [Trichonephila clavipes]|nr:hypothetical protein TNCV_4524821 [Trichonephila clavipes]
MCAKKNHPNSIMLKGSQSSQGLLRKCSMTENAGQYFKDEDDNALCHRAKAVQNGWKTILCIRMNWSGQSPDLTIEFMVCTGYEISKSKLGKVRCGFSLFVPPGASRKKSAAFTKLNSSRGAPVGKCLLLG